MHSQVIGKPSTIQGVNRLAEEAKREIYARLIPPPLFETFNLSKDLKDSSGNDLLDLKSPAGSSSTEMALYHQYGFRDPVLYGHITDTLNGQIHVLLYILNDPSSARFDVDRMPDGKPTEFGTRYRNLAAEQAAMEYGLAPGQIRSGLRMLRQAIGAFEEFVASLGHELYFAEPLYYHNAIIFERYGFAYQKGRRLMERIQVGFQKDGDLRGKLDRSTPFRQPEAVNSIRLRSWAIHDGILGQPFNEVTMYKRVGKSFDISTCQACAW
jgi:hypothetical protein